MIQKPFQSLIDELYAVETKAEIVDGKVVLMGPTGSWPTRAAGFIFASLLEHEAANPDSGGVAYNDNVGILVDLPNRKSFSPDVCYCFDVEQHSMRFLETAPAFVVEVRSENDYGPAAEMKIKQKRLDYFSTGTTVVWDVDLQSEELITAYRCSAPDQKTVFCVGELAHAEPAVPGWKFAVDRICFSG